MTGTSPATLVDLVRSRAEERGEEVVFVHLVDGEEEEEVPLTFGEVDRRARAIAGAVRRSTDAGDRVLLPYPPGLEFITGFLGCLYAGRLAVPTYPPEPLRLERTLGRLVAVVRDARPTLVMTTSLLGDMREQIVAQAPPLGDMPWLASDEVDDDLAADWTAPDLSSESPASIQYTSGSTGAPKGVVLSHGNLLHNAELVRRAFSMTAEDRMVSWLPMLHDMGFMSGLLAPLYVGPRTLVMSPMAFLQHPARWLKAISRSRATISGGPNFAYELCLRKVSPAERAQLDLSCWQLAFNGAEPVRADTLDAFSAAFGLCGFRPSSFYPCYGLAEATLIVSGGVRGAEPIVHAVEAGSLASGRAVAAGAADAAAQRVVSSGRPLAGQRIAIVDPDTSRPLPAGRIGEVWISGPSVAQGYWGRPEETRVTFGARLEGDDATYLRSGDLGLLLEGELVLTGRHKDLIIVRGVNHYPQDIELTVERCHPALRPGCGAAFAVERDGEERLVVVHEIDTRKPADGREVVAAIAREVAEQHGLTVDTAVLIPPRSIPKTSSGKIQRRACRMAFLEEGLAPVYTWSRAEQTQAVGPAEAEAPSPSRSARRSPAARAIEERLVRMLGRAVGMEPASIDVERPFSEYGIGSADAVGLAGEIEDWLERKLPASLLYEHVSVRDLARHLAEGDAVPQPRRRGPARGPVPDEDRRIAIVGVGCRFPGAPDARAFWELLRSGGDAIAAVPPERWDSARYYDADPRARGRTNTRWGGFVSDVDRFDAGFFRMSPREAERTDPQQRLLLEVAWQALEDAGQDAARLAGTRVGVFVGVSSSEYGWRELLHTDEIDAYSATGNALSVAANRVSYAFDLHGPSLAVDTACSSSLVALHLACESIRRGESTLALAGGANLLLGPALYIGFSKAGVMSPDGRCKAFDARADGYVRGEGAGMVLLKPLAAALRDGDFVYAVVRGSAVCQDGRTNGLMAPSREAQEAVLEQAYRDAGAAPAETTYVEAHGTGTLLGDLIEARALGAVVGAGRSGGRCAIGSVKTNIGHLEAAAGIAGVIKVALMLSERTLVPSLHFERPNPHADLGQLGLRVQTAPETLRPDARPVVAGVSSFGFGGTNAHAVLEEAPPLPPPEAARAERDAFQILALSARSPEALQCVARSHRELLDGRPDGALPDLCASRAVRSTHHEYRLAVVGRSCAEIAGKLDALAQGRAGPGAGSSSDGENRRLLFVYSGQGSQWRGMGCELLRSEPSYREKIEECDAWIERETGWSLLADLRADAPRSRFDEVDFVQPAIFAVQVGLTALWRSWGVHPDAVVGQSLGEVAAATAAGILSVDDGCRVICERSRLLRAVQGRGGMAVVGLSEADATAQIADLDGRVAIAVENGPDSVVVAGEAEALAVLLERLAGSGVFCQRVEVNYASHTGQMEPLCAELATRLKGLAPREADLPMISTVTGRLEDGAVFDERYWARNLREPVQLWTVLKGLADAGTPAFVEVSPHPVVSGAIQDAFRHLGRQVPVHASLRREKPERGSLLDSVAALYASGTAVAWRAIYPASRPVRELPPYPFQRQRFWSPQQDAGIRAVAARGEADGRHPLLGRRLDPAGEPGNHFWERSLPDGEPPDAMSLLETVLAAASETAAGREVAVEDFEVRRPLDPATGPERTVQVGWQKVTEELQAVRILSRGGDPGWVLHAEAGVRLAAARGERTADRVPLSEVRARCGSPVPLEHLRAECGTGPGRADADAAAQATGLVWRGSGEGVARLRLPEGVAATDPGGAVHPALLRAAIELLGWSGGDDRARDLARAVRLRARAFRESEAWAVARVTPGGDDAGDLEGEVALCDSLGRAFLEVERLRLRPADAPAAADAASARDSAPGSRSGTGGIFAGVRPDEYGSVLEAYLVEQIALVSGLDADAIDPARPLADMGIDSLMAVELRNRMEADLGTVLTATMLWRYPTVQAVVPFLLGKMGMLDPAVASPADAAEAAESAARDRALARIESLDDERIVSLIEESLAEHADGEKT